MRGLAGRRAIAAVARGLSCQLEGISSNVSAQLVCSVAPGSPCVGGWKESQRECWRHNQPHVSPFTRQLHVAERTFCTSPAASEPADPATEDGSSTSAAADSGDTSLEEHSLALDSELTPKAVVEKLDKNIVGQEDAKKAVAIALRNRWRRHRVSKGMQEEIVPKNILMIGPTGCGKTEIARRLAKLADAPFVKVEATKFTEVGFHGRDVDQIVRDLVDNSMLMVKERLRCKHKKEVEQRVENIILQALFGPEPSAASGEAGTEAVNTHETFRRHLHSGLLEDRDIKVEVNLSSGSNDPLELIGDMMARIQRPRGPRREQRTMTVREARDVLSDQEMEKYFSQESIQREAITAVEQDGIVFIDEIDKIVTNSSQRYSVDASSEGVQRDLLPIIEGSVVQTKAGNVKTDHVLFICSGSFHACKPSDMLAELQGRLPIRVELKGLTRDDFYRILTEPENNMIHQQQALLGTEGVELTFTEGAIREIARVAEEANRMLDNIGARRLHTILERIVEDVSFNAPELRADADDTFQYQVDRELVTEKVAALLRKKDMSKYVL